MLLENTVGSALLRRQRIVLGAELWVYTLPCLHIIVLGRVEGLSLLWIVFL